MRARLSDAVDVVGVVTLAMGIALSAEPHRAGRALGLGGPALVRAIGVVDLVLAPRLLDRRRPRALPMALRSGLNAVIVAAYLEQARTIADPTLARRGAVMMAGLVVLDGGLAAAVHRAEVSGAWPAPRRSGRR